MVRMFVAGLTYSRRTASKSKQYALTILRTQDKNSSEKIKSSPAVIIILGKVLCVLNIREIPRNAVSHCIDYPSNVNLSGLAPAQTLSWCFDFLQNRGGCFKTGKGRLANTGQIANLDSRRGMAENAT